MRLGLANPVVTNRFLLWVFAAFFGFVMVCTAVPPVVLGRTHLLSHAALVLVGFAGLGSAVCNWLVFFPPAAYRRRVYARAEAEV
jgi:hypothetical protein